MRSGRGNRGSPHNSPKHAEENLSRLARIEQLGRPAATADAAYGSAATSPVAASTPTLPNLLADYGGDGSVGERRGRGASGILRRERFVSLWRPGGQAAAFTEQVLLSGTGRWNLRANNLRAVSGETREHTYSSGVVFVIDMHT